MGGISIAIELQDNFTGIMMNIVNAITMSVAAVEQMQSVISGTIDTGSIEQANEAVRALNDTLQNMETPSLSQRINVDVNLVAPDPLVENTEVEVPIRWQSDNLEVFTNTGIERFRQEVQSTNTMLQQLSSTQDAIARQAYNADIFPQEAFQNLNTMAVRIDNIRDRIQQIESNPLNMGTNAANVQLEQLRAQLNQAVQEQELMNQAVQNMDVQAANEAYLRLSQIIGNTERYIRDNADEQGRLNDAIKEGTASAEKLQNMMVSAVKAIGDMDWSKAKDWIEDCTAAYNAQLNAEVQLIGVLANALDEEYVAKFAAEVSTDTTAATDEINAMQNSVDGVVVPVTAEAEALTAAYAQITSKINEIQGRGVFGSEAMIAGVAELSTYFSDPEAVVVMMDTLSDYAMGMNALDGKGLAVDASSMGEYATNLGKVMTGNYTDMSENNFEFTDAQKAVIEKTATESQIVEVLGTEYLDMSADMQAAAVIGSVVGKTWEGLYEMMSDTPEGKIIQMTNTWGSMKEVVGGQLYPYVLLFVDVITQNWGTIQAVIDVITFGLQMMLGVMAGLLEGALGFAQNVIDNWGQIAPVVSTIAGALLALCAAFFIYKAVMSVVTTVQALFNTTLLGCPVVWILVIIIAVIVAVYKIVEAVNNATGSTVSAIGIIMGVLAVAGALLCNLVLGVVELVIGLIEYLINPFLNFANFIGNLFKDPIGSVIHLFGDMTDTVLELLQKVASAMDFVLGTSMADTVQEWRDNLSDKINEAAEQYGNGQYEEIVSRLDVSIEDMGLYRISYGEAWDAGYSFGEGIDESISNFDPSSLFGTTDIPSAEEYANVLAGGGIGNDINNIAGNTGAMADAMAITEEELKYLRDIAEQEIINRFTTAEIHLEQTNHNTIKNGMDLDGIMSGMTDMMNEAIDISTEGVHV